MSEGIHSANEIGIIITMNNIFFLKKGCNDAI